MSVFVKSSYHNYLHQLHWDSHFVRCSAEPVADKCLYCHMESDLADSLLKACAPALLLGQYTRKKSLRTLHAYANFLLSYVKVKFNVIPI